MRELVPQIDRAIAMAKGLDIDARQEIYAQVAMRMVQAGIPDQIWHQFSKGMLEIAHEFYGWDKTPPIWLHGGPAGLEAGDTLRPWPYAPSTRKTLAQNTRAALGLEKPHKTPYVFFTPDRELAAMYEARTKGVIYEVKPEGDIWADPDMLARAVIYGRDPEIDWSENLLMLFVLALAPAFCARSARVVRLC